MKGEIDVYIPDKKVGIETHGMFWHSTHMLPDPLYHQKKALAAIRQGIKLLQFWEYQIKDPHYWTICKSMIQHALGLSKKIYARNCTVKLLSNDEYMHFVNANHIQGYASAKVCIGLFCNDELYSVLSLSPPRFDKSYQWEIIRYATKCGYAVIGGFSKMLSYFFKMFKPKSIMTYADLMFGYGHVYKVNGFSFVSILKPSYFYFKEPDIVISRYKAQQLSKILGDNYDPSISEEENMIRNGFYKLYDAGSIKWELKL